MTQERLTNIGIISIERELASNIDYDNIIDKFAKKKRKEKEARKVAI